MKKFYLQFFYLFWGSLLVFSGEGRRREEDCLDFGVVALSFLEIAESEEASANEQADADDEEHAADERGARKGGSLAGARVG